MRGIKMQLYSEDEKNIIKKFISGGCSFEDTCELFSNSEKVRKSCQELYDSPAFLHEVLGSKSMHFSNKIVLLKYLKVISQNTA